MDFISMLQHVYAVPNQYIFDLVHKDRVHDSMMETLWHLTQCITVYSLPITIREKQYHALVKRYPQVIITYM